MNKSNRLAIFGAVLYILWGLLHFMAAYAVFKLAQSTDSMVHGRLVQAAWNLACFSVAAIGIAVFFNLKNSLWGYWVNVAIISVADLGFIFFVLVPGLMPLWPGALGPVLWLVGLALSTAGIMQRASRAV
ncbi:MAG: hypothetical protein V4505_03495 [Pseudomonadota bacterium]